MRPYLERARAFSLDDLAELPELRELRELAKKEATEHPLLALALAFVAGIVFGIGMSRR